MSRKSRRRRMRDPQGAAPQDGFDFLDDRETRTVVAPAPSTPLAGRPAAPAPVRAARAPAAAAPLPAAGAESVAAVAPAGAPVVAQALTMTVELPASFGTGPGDAGTAAETADGAAVAGATVDPVAAGPGADAVPEAAEAPAAPLPTVGEMLITAREAHGLSVEAAAGRTRIPVKMLQHLEADRFGEFAADAYARGTLRAYGAFLRVDLTALLSRYDAAAGRALAAAPAAAVPEARAAAQEDAPARSRARTSRAPRLDRRAGLALTALVLLLGGGAAGFAAWQRGSGLRPQAGLSQIESELRQSQAEPTAVSAAPEPAAGAGPVRTGEDTAPAAPATQVPAASSPAAPAAAAPITDLLEAPGAAAPAPAKTAGAASSPVVPADGSLMLTATASGPCTVRLAVDAPRSRAVPFNFTAGETRSWTARKSFRLVARRGANLQLALNGRPIPTPGDGRAVTLDRFTLDPKPVPAAQRRQRPKPRPKPAPPAAAAPVFEAHGGMLPPL